MSDRQQLRTVDVKNKSSTKQDVSSKNSPSLDTHPSAIVLRARTAPGSLTPADVLQLQRTIGNQAVGQLLAEIGRLPSTSQQVPVQRQGPEEEEELMQGKMMDTVQRQGPEEEEELMQGKMIETVQRQEIPEEEEPIQGKMMDTVQRQGPEEEEELMQGKMIETVQRQEIPEEEEPIQGKFASGLTGTLQGKGEATPNKTGMPDHLKSGIENVSGMDLSGVRVHYNSSKPEQLNALAYAQGSDIHVAPGQEQHLPHEAWHVVQQAQGRVRPTMQARGVAINDDAGLEKEADLLGARANTKQPTSSQKSDFSFKSHLITNEKALLNKTIMQRRKLEFKVIRELAYKSLRAWVSPGISKWTKNQGLEFVVAGILRGAGKDYDKEDTQAIVDFVNGYQNDILKIAPSGFDSFIEKLGSYGGATKYIKYLESIEWPKNLKPSIVFGRAVTTAFYDSARHVITLDPWKLNTWTEILDSMTFECQNALQREEIREALRKGGKETAEVEYESDKHYVEALYQINNVEGINALVTALAIPKRFLVEANYDLSKRNCKVDRPDRSQLPEQNKRQALWWWMTKSWTEKQRQDVWILENHGEGVKSSVELYSSKK
jgi:hypothetical protein